jgi:hypothetical protein
MPNAECRMLNAEVFSLMWRGIQHSAFSIRHSAFGIQHSAFSIRHSAFGIRH